MVYYYFKTIEGMNRMAEFCKCGSVMINGSCTNKKCSNKLVKAASATKVSKTGRTRTVKETPAEKPKSTKTVRASKCITYHISELPLKEQPK